MNSPQRACACGGQLGQPTPMPLPPLTCMPIGWPGIPAPGMPGMPPAPGMPGRNMGAPPIGMAGRMPACTAAACCAACSAACVAAEGAATGAAPGAPACCCIIICRCCMAAIWAR